MRIRSAPLMRRLMTSIVAATVVMFTLGYCAVYQRTLSSLKAQYQSGAQASLGQIGMELGRFAQDVETLALNLPSGEMLSALGRGEGSGLLGQVRARQAAIEEIRALLSVHPQLHAIMFVDTEGRLFGASSQRTYLSAFADAPLPGVRRFRWFARGKDISFADIRNPYYVAQNGVPVLTCAYYMRSGGMILACAQASAIRDIFSAFALPCDTLCLLDERGETLWSREGGAPSAETNGVHVVEVTLPGRGWRAVATVPESYYTESMRGTLAAILATGVMTLVLLVAICAALTARLTRPLKDMANSMRLLGGGNLNARMSEDPYVSEYGAIARCFNETASRLQYAQKQREKDEAERREMEMDVLKSQIDPHFLLNTLTSLRWLAVMARADTVAGSLLHLCNLIEPLFRTREDMWRVETECEFLGHYVALMNMRFGDMVRFEMTVAPETRGYRIPRFILQPLLENSYEHSVDGMHAVVVRLEIAEQAGELVLCVRDDGQGMPSERLSMIRQSIEKADDPERPTRGIGQWSVWRRLRLCYGDAARMSVDSAPGEGTTVRLALRLEAVEKEDTRA